jgi:antitoxin YefM
VTTLARRAKYEHVSDYKEARMAITASEARRDLVHIIERVNLDRTEIEIVSERGSAVLMSKDEFEALMETSYLLRSPRNARRLISALEAVGDTRRSTDVILPD